MSDILGIPRVMFEDFTQKSHVFRGEFLWNPHPDHSLLGDHSDLSNAREDLQEGRVLVEHCGTDRVDGAIEERWMDDVSWHRIATGDGWGWMKAPGDWTLVTVKNADLMPVEWGFHDACEWWLYHIWGEWTSIWQLLSRWSGHPIFENQISQVGGWVGQGDTTIDVLSLMKNDTLFSSDILWKKSCSSC